MTGSLGFVQSEAQALIGIPATISYRDSLGNQKSVSATIKYVTPIGFAAIQAGTGQILLFTYAQVVSVAKIQAPFNWNNLLLYGGGTLAFAFIFGRMFGIDRLLKGRAHGRR